MLRINLDVVVFLVRLHSFAEYIENNAMRIDLDVVHIVNLMIGGGVERPDPTEIFRLSPTVTD